MDLEQCVTDTGDSVPEEIQDFQGVVGGDSRIGVNLIQETPTIALVKYASETPGLLLERLHILYLNDKNISRLRGLDFERTGQVVNLGQVDVSHIICAVVVSNLSTRPVYTFDLDNLVVLDRAAERY